LVGAGNADYELMAPKKKKNFPKTIDPPSRFCSQVGGQALSKKNTKRGREIEKREKILTSKRCKVAMSGKKILTEANRHHLNWPQGQPLPQGKLSNKVEK